MSLCKIKVFKSIKLFLLLISACFIVFISKAELIGFDFYYSHLEDDKYKVTLIQYYSCSSDLIDSTQAFYIYESLSQLFVKEQIIPLIKINDTITHVPIECNTKNQHCLKRVVYSVDISLRNPPGGYDLIYGEKGFPDQFDNLQSNSSKNHIVSSIHIPEVRKESYNTMSELKFLPLPLLCLNRDFNYLFFAEAIDNDSLTYNFSEIQSVDFNRRELSSGIPSEFPDQMLFSPPFVTVSYKSNFSKDNPLGEKNKPEIKDNNIEFNPVAVGKFLTGISVSEYKNGSLITDHQLIFLISISN